MALPSAVGGMPPGPSRPSAVSLTAGSPAACIPTRCNPAPTTHIAGRRATGWPHHWATLRTLPHALPVLDLLVKQAKGEGGGALTQGNHHRLWQRLLALHECHPMVAQGVGGATEGPEMEGRVNLEHWALEGELKLLAHQIRGDETCRPAGGQDGAGPSLEGFSRQGAPSTARESSRTVLMQHQHLITEQ